MSHDAREASFIAGSTWQDEDCWAASIEVVGGYYIAALAYGSTKAEAEQRRSTILATLSPDPVLLGEVREVLTDLLNFGREVGWRDGPTIRRTRAILAKLPKLTGEEV